jgi:hypothetical protein
MRGDQAPLPLRALNADQLAELSSALHDWWLDFDALNFEERRIVVPIQAEGQVGRLGWEGPPEAFGARLVIDEVTELRSEDPEQIGSYTLTEIRSTNGFITLVAMPKLVIEARVDAIAVVAQGLDTPE